MAQEKKDTTAVTVSLTDESIREFDAWRLDQPFSPSRSKVVQQMLNEFLTTKRQEAQEALEAQEASKHSVTTVAATIASSEEKKPKAKQAAA